jgi:GxxExxY protein
MDFDALTETVLRGVFEVSNTLGAGFLERVYRNALVAELRLRGMRAEVEFPLPVHYKGQVVGEYFADIVVEDVLILELKCVEAIRKEHVGQCVNYLRASGLTLCLLINFQKPKVEWRRVVLGFEKGI